MSDNTTAVIRFVNDNNLQRDSCGRGSFAAKVTISSSGTYLIANTVGHFRFANDFEDRIVLEETTELVSGEVPLGFNDKYGHWKCVEAALLIDGNYPALGEYTVKIECE